MYKILIDTTDRYSKKIILQKNEEIIEESNGDFDLVSEIASLLKKHNLKPNDITELEANPGPGSFTGIKIGITIANILNWANGSKKLQKPAYGAEPNIYPTKWLESDKID